MDLNIEISIAVNKFNNLRLDKKFKSLDLLLERVLKELSEKSNDQIEFETEGLYLSYLKKWSDDILKAIYDSPNNTKKFYRNYANDKRISSNLKKSEEIGNTLQTISFYTQPIEHKSQIFCMELINYEGKNLIASGGAYLDENINIWEVATGQLVKTLKGHTHAICSLKFYETENENKFLISSSTDKTIRVWDIQSGRCFQIFEAANICFCKNFEVFQSEEGRNLIIAKNSKLDKNFNVWDLLNGECIMTVEFHERTIKCFASIKNNDNKFLKFVATGDGAGVICLWNVNTWQSIFILEGHVKEITCLLPIEQHQILISASEDYSIKIWDYENGILTRTLQGHDKAVNTVIFINTNARNLIASGGRDNKIKLWNVLTGEELLTFEEQKEILILQNLNFMDKNVIASCTYSNILRLWDVDEKRIIREYESSRENNGRVTSLLNLPLVGKNLLMISHSADKQIKILDLLSFANTSINENEFIVTNSLTVKKNDNLTLIIIGFNSGEIQVWECPSDEECKFSKYLIGHLRRINCLININIINDDLLQEQDDTLIASGSMDFFIKIWSVNKGTCSVNLFNNSHDDYTCIVQLPLKNACLIAGGTRVGGIKIWDFSTGKCVTIIKEAHADLIKNIIYLEGSNNGHLIASVSWDIVKIWDVHSGKLQRTVSGTFCMVGIEGKETLLAIAEEDNSIIVVDPLKEFEILKVLKGHNDKIFNMIYFSEENDFTNKRFIASASKGVIKMWDLFSGNCISTFYSKTDLYLLMYIPLGNKKLIAGTTKEFIKLWDIASGKCIQLLEGHNKRVTCLSKIEFKKKTLILSGSEDSSVKLWSLSYFKKFITFSGYPNYIIHGLEN